MPAKAATKKSKVPQLHVVQGRIVTQDGSAIVGERVSAYAKRLRSKDVALGTSVRTDKEGRYVIKYKPRPKGVDVYIKVYRGKEVVATSPVVLNLEQEETIDVVVGGEYRGPSQYERVGRDLASVLETTVVRGKDLVDFSDEDLALLSTKSGVDPRELVLLIQCATLADETKLPEELFYGLGCQNMPLSLPGLLAQDPAKRWEAIDAAIDARQIPASLTGEVKRGIEKLEELTIKEALRDPKLPRETTLGGLLAVAGLPPTKRKKLVETYAKHDGSNESFWAGLRSTKDFSETEVRQVQFTLQLGAIAQNHLPLVRVLLGQKSTKLKALVKLDKINELKDLAKLDKVHWLELIQTNIEGTSKKSVKNSKAADFSAEEDEEKTVGLPIHLVAAGISEEEYAEMMFRVVEQAFLTEMVAHRVEGFPDSELLKDFFKNNPTFDLQSMPIQDYLKKNPLSLSWLANEDDEEEKKAKLEKGLEGLNRLKPIIPAGAFVETSQILQKENFDSAQKICVVGKAAFKRRVQKKLGEPQVESLWNNASNRAAVSQVLLARHHAMFDRAPIAALPKRVELTNYESLFGSLDFCSCEHCQSMYSPAAYLTDVLFWLNNRGENEYGKNPREVLFDHRRGDIGTIELSCKNTNTPLPYIDLVNETLELLVAPPGGSWPGYQTTGTPADLLAHPEHLHAPAYDVLAKDAVYPFNLPYNLWLDEARTYLGQLGVTRYRLMDVCHKDGTQAAWMDDEIAAQVIGLSPLEWKIIAGETIAGTEAQDFWGMPRDSAWVDNFKNVSLLLDKATMPLSERSMEFDEIAKLVSTDFIKSEDTLGVWFESLSCDTTKAKILGLFETHLDRLHRFVRLQRRLGWSIDDLDRAIVVLGKGILDNKFLLKLSHVLRLLADLRVPIPELLTWWGKLDTRRLMSRMEQFPPDHIEGRSSGFGFVFGHNSLTAKPKNAENQSQYDRLFQNSTTTVIPEIEGQDPPFGISQDGKKLLDESKELLTFASDVTAALGIAAEDLTTLLPLLPDKKLTLTNLSALYRHVSFARAMDLSLRQLVSLLDLTGINPFDVTHTEYTLKLVQELRSIRESGFTIEELDYLLRHIDTKPASFEPEDEGIGILLIRIRDQLRKVEEGIFSGLPSQSPDELQKILESKAKKIVEEQNISQVLALVFMGPALAQNLIDFADAATSGSPRDKISQIEAKDLLKLFKAGGEVSGPKWEAVEYILREYQWNNEAKEWFENQLSEVPIITKLNEEIDELAYRRVAGIADGEIDRNDAKDILDLFKEGKQYTQLERDTIRHILEKYNWTEEAKQWFNTEVKKWIIEIIKSSFQPLFNADDVYKKLVGSGPGGSAQIVRVVERLEFALAPILKYWREPAVIQELASGLSLDTKLATPIIRQYLSLLETFLDRDLIDWPKTTSANVDQLPTASDLPEQFAAYKRLHKVSLLIQHFRISHEELPWVFEYGPKQGTLNFQSLAPYTRLTVSTLVKGGANNQVAACTTTGNHGLSVGSKVNIFGANPSAYNRVCVVSSIPESNVFTYDLGSDPGDNASGTISAKRLFESTLKIQSLERGSTNNQIATCTTDGNHGLSVGSKVNIFGASPSAYNGLCVVSSIPESNIFTYDLGSDPGENASGSMSAKILGEAFQAWARLRDAVAVRDKFSGRKLFDLFGNASTFLLGDDIDSAKEALLTELANRTGWLKSDIEFLAGENAFNFKYPDDWKDERALKQLHDTMIATHRLGVSAETLWGFRSIPEAIKSLRKQAEAIKQAVRARYDESQWHEVARALRDQLRQRQRDALVSWLIAPNYLAKHTEVTARSLKQGGAGNRIATCTTATPHGLMVGDSVKILGARPAPYNGVFVVDTVPSSIAFTYRPKTDPGSDASGVIRAKGKIKIHSLVRGGTGNRTITCTSNTDHGLKEGDEVEISGAVPSDYNGLFVVANVQNTTGFTFQVEVAPGDDGSRGGLSAQHQVLIKSLKRGEDDKRIITCTTKTDHGLKVGKEVQISNVVSSGYNGSILVMSVQNSTVFTFHVEVDPGSDATSGILRAPQNIFIRSLIWVDSDNPTVTCTTAHAHGLSTGESVEISGAILPDYNGLFVVASVKNSAVFTYHLASNPGGDAKGISAGRRGFRDVNDLFGHLLLDVQMSPCQLTSRIKQANSSVQLYVQRALLSQEEGVTLSSEDSREWKLMKNYRVWEANRKVFLYPENWIEPELRDNKSPFFEELENDLMQKEVTAESAERLVLSYLEKLDEVARLEVVGFFHQKSTEDQQLQGDCTDILHVFARTRGTPYRYFYRQRVDGARWTPWEKLDVDIEGDHVLPVVFNRRLYLFWMIFTEAAIEKAPVTPDPQALPKDTLPAEKYFQLRLAWSEFRNGKWSGKKLSTVQIGATPEYYKQHKEVLKKDELSTADDFFMHTFEEGGDLVIEPIRRVSSVGSIPIDSVRLDRFRLSGCDGTVSLGEPQFTLCRLLDFSYPGVFFRVGNNLYIYLKNIFDNSGQPWKLVNITKACPKAPVPASNPTAWHDGNTFGITYRDHDGHINIVFTHGRDLKDWFWANLSEVFCKHALSPGPCKPPPATRNPVGSLEITAGKADVVVYLDQDNNIQLLEGHGVWGTPLNFINLKDEITPPINALPSCAGNPTIQSNEDRNSYDYYILYRDTNDHIQLLTRRHFHEVGMGMNTKLEDLTEAGDEDTSILAVGDPVITKSRKVFYRDKDGRIYMLKPHSQNWNDLAWEKEDLTPEVPPQNRAAGDPVILEENDKVAVAYRDPAGNIMMIYQNQNGWNKPKNILEKETDPPRAVGDPVLSGPRYKDRLRIKEIYHIFYPDKFGNMQGVIEKDGEWKLIRNLPAQVSHPIITCPQDTHIANQRFTRTVPGQGLTLPVSSGMEPTLGRTPSSFEVVPHSVVNFTSREPFFFQDLQRTFFVETPQGVEEDCTPKKWTSNPELIPVDIHRLLSVYGLQSDGQDTIANYLMAHVRDPLRVGKRGDPGSLCDHLVLRSTQFAEQSRALREVTQVRQHLLSSKAKFSSPGLLLRAGNRQKYRFAMFSHPYLCVMMRQLNRFGLDGLLDPSSSGPEAALRRQQKKKKFFEGLFYPQTAVFKPYPEDQFDFTLEGAYSLYNWELFFHLPFLIASHLTKNQRFEDALQWFHYIFDPTESSEESAPQRFWKFRPFFELFHGEDLEAGPIHDLLLLLDDDYVGSDTKKCEARRALFAQFAESRKNPFNPHAIARLRPTAYQKAVFLKYIDNLIEWGDQLFRRDTMESVNEATQLYILAAQLLGRRPQQVEVEPSPPTTFNSILDKGPSAFTNNFMEAIEGRLEAIPNNSYDIKQDPPVFGLTQFFCVPPNHSLFSDYWDRVADRLFKLRHCMNIEGVVRQLPLFEPPIDPGLLVRATAAGVDLASALSDFHAALPYHRFQLLSQKATELCADVRGLGQALLAALEKKDAEELALLRAGHETKLQTAVIEVRKKQIDEAKETLESLKRSKENAEIRRSYYRSRPFMNQAETAQFGLYGAAGILDVAAGVAHLLGATTGALPNLSVGVAGFGGTPTMTLSYGGSQLGNTSKAVGDWLKVGASALDRSGQLAGLLGSYHRRQDDWNHHADLAQKDIQGLEKQILAAEIRVAIVEKELDNLDLQIEQSKETEKFFRDKYTNKELYQWMVGQISSLYFQSYKLAYDMAKRAERAWQFELAQEDRNFIQFGHWDGLKKGLLAGERLHQDIKRMEVAYLEDHRREYELTRHVSLRILDPMALEQLRSNGECIVHVPEAWFDLDSPGHYMRRIKTVAISIPAVTGPYVPVRCTLTLLRNTVRISSNVPNEYKRNLNDDNRFRDDVVGIQSIVTSRAEEDSGLFETNLRDERYLPFEGAGADSTWRLELPDPNRFPQFDYQTISDVVLHIRYTARDGGTAMKDEAASELYKALQDLVVGSQELSDKKGLFHAVSARRDFPDEWVRFLNPHQDAGNPSMTIGLTSEIFPFAFQGSNINVVGLELFLVVDDIKTYRTETPMKLSVEVDRVTRTITMKSDETILNGLPHGSPSHWQATTLGALGVMLKKNENQNAAGSVVQINEDKIRLISSAVDDLILVLRYKVEAR